MRIAVVGSGIAGLSAAWLLSPQHEVVVFEENAYAGGHGNTVDVTLEGMTYPVDTGFLVHNDRTYPNLIALFNYLGVSTQPSEMSFAVSLPAANVEWAGASLFTLFAQASNLWRPAFWRMVRDIVRFNRAARTLLTRTEGSARTLGQILGEEGYSAEFRDWYLYPMGAAIWSSPLKDISQFPAESFLRFCLNHGLLQLFNRPQWRTVTLGSRRYVNAMLTRLRDVRLSCPVLEVRRGERGVLVRTAHGLELFDKVIMACHTDQTLALLTDANATEVGVLASIRYQTNTAYLHTDTRLMPQRLRTWSAWNYYANQASNSHTPQAGADVPTEPSPVAVTYWLNKLQALPFKQPLFVTLNPPSAPAPNRVLQTFHYAHPVLNQTAYAAQRDLASLQGQHNLYFCGAWAGYGFHEDGLKSGMRVAQLLGAHIPWKMEE